MEGVGGLHHSAFNSLFDIDISDINLVKGTMGSCRRHIAAVKLHNTTCVHANLHMIMHKS